MGISDKFADVFWNLYVFSFDNTLALLNLITPKLKPGEVVPSGGPGHHGKWGDFVPPKEGP